MMTLDDLFSRQTDSLHPQVRKWKARLAEPNTSATLDVFLPDSGLGQPPPEMTLQFAKDGEPLPEETLPWDDDLNSGLIQLGVRSVSQGQEAKRFALGLRAAMRKASRDVGDGYFNSVLVEFLTEIGPTLHSDIAEIITYIDINQLRQEVKASDRYTTCRELIADAISGRAHELTELLGYSRGEAKDILGVAIYDYLDKRFSVSYRRRRGLL